MINQRCLQGGRNTDELLSLQGNPLGICIVSSRDRHFFGLFLLRMRHRRAIYRESGNKILPESLPTFGEEVYMLRVGQRGIRHIEGREA